MSYTYSQRKQAGSIGPKSEAASPQASPEALSNGAMQPTAEQLGRRVDLPDAMRSKMENAFGADLGAVKLYESRAVAETGAKAIARGADIAFAPGMLDFSSFGGQALLGHELSHVVSQARGEVTGSGFLSDAALEARADREGAMAAAGQAVAMPTASLSPVSAADAAGPMQAKDKPEKQEKFGFTSEPGEKSALPAGGIGFVLGMENADDPNHGAEFRQMMASLKANAVAKGNRRHLGGMAYDAMAGSGADQAITGMEAYRKKLKSERGNRAERKRQIAILDDMIARARSDKARTEARQTTELGGTEFTGTMLGGGINQVYQ